MYNILAISIALTHGILVVILTISPFFVISGWIFKHKFFEELYIICGWLTILSYILYRACFLTFWEQDLLVKAESSRAYTGGFISHYLSTIFNISIKDIWVFYYLIIILTIGLGGIVLYHGKQYLKKRSLTK